MNPKQNDADETEPPYPREHPGHHRGYSWRENNGDRYATAGATLRPEVRAYFGSDGSTAASRVEELFVAQELIKTVKLKCCGIIEITTNMMKKIFISLSLLLLTSLSVSAQKIDQRLTKLVEPTALHRTRGTALPFAPKDVNKSIAVDFRADGTIAALSAIATLKEGAECPTERLQQMGIEVRFQIGDMVALRIPADKLMALEGIEEFRYVQADEVMQKNNEKARAATGVELVNTAEKAAAQQLPKAYTGEGVVLGIIDGGIDFNHAAFRNADGSTRIKKAIVYQKEGENVVKKVYTTDADIKSLTVDANDDSHGTHTSAIAGGSDTGNGQQGMAPQVDLVLCGLGFWLSTSNIAECIQDIFDYAISVNKPAVVSISLGNTLGLHDGSEEVCKTVARLTENGTKPGRAVVISSSNAAANCQSIIQSLNKANADADGFELKTVLGASKTETDRKDLPVMYSDNYYIYAEDYKEFTLSYAVVDITTGEFVGIDHLKYVDDNKQVQNLDSKLVMFYDDEKPTAKGGKAFIYMINFRPLPTYLDNANYRLVLLLKGSHDGQVIKMMSNGENAYEPCFSAPVVKNGYNFQANGYTRGNSEFAFSTSTCSDAVISIGSYITRDNWTDYLGNPRKYIESAVTNKLQVVGEISDFSSYGVDDNGKPRPTAIAPGQGIISAGNNWDREIFYDNQAGVPNPSKGGSAYLCQNVEKNKRSNWYILSQGTSMACPVAAGIIALWMQAKPSLTVNEINAILKETCVNDEWTATANIPSVNKVQAGYGKINALAGLKKILGTVGIETISADGHREATPATMYSVDAPVYNMMGQRVSKSQKGLVIYKGRKYLNK